MKVSLAQAQELQGEAKFAAYACLDTTGTGEVFDVLEGRLTAEQRRIYEWSKAQQSPALTMTLRGVAVNDTERKRAVRELRKDLLLAVKQVQINQTVVAVWDGTDLETGFCAKGKALPSGNLQRHKWPKGVEDATRSCERCGTPRVIYKPFEPGSVHQTKHLLYDLLHLPKQRNKDGGISVDDDALQRIVKKSPEVAPLVVLLQTVRDCVKQIGTLSAKLSPTGRFHSSFNVGAAWTGRWSSSSDPFGQGGNLQNVTEKHRYVFVPDPGMKMGYADLKTAESLKVAYLSGDEKYIEAHKGDVHTWVCREVWPELPWNGDIKKDKKIASSLIPPWDNLPGHDYRFQSKRIQHGSNFGLSPGGVAMIAKIPFKQAMHAQGQYFTAFPEIRKWQSFVIDRVTQQLPIYNSLRRYVKLFGRPWDGHTHKQGLAFGPQSSIGDVLNLGLWRVWRYMDPALLEILAQVHDAILFQYLIGLEAEVLQEIVRYMKVEVPVVDFRGKSRLCVVPVEVAVGQNWGKKSEKNPFGLEEVTL